MAKNRRQSVGYRLGIPVPCWSGSLVNRAREEQFTPLHRFNNDGVFIDGKYLQSAGSKNEVDKGCFFVDYDAKQIYIGLIPPESWWK